MMIRGENIKEIKSLLILTSFLLISCDSEVSEAERAAYNAKIQAAIDADYLESYGDVRTDFACTSYKIDGEFFDMEDTSHELIYSHNLGRRTTWVNDELISDNVFDTAGRITFWEDEELFYIFFIDSNRLEKTLVPLDGQDVQSIYFHCLPLKPLLTSLSLKQYL